MDELATDDPVNAFKAMSTDELVSFLRSASDAYYNRGTPMVSDDVFDLAKDELEAKAPNHPFLTEVGAPPLPSDEKGGGKVKLPHYLGSLDKIRDDQKALDRWTASFPGPVVVSDKLDGNSAMVVFVRSTKTTLVPSKMYSRGNGFEGQDISHLLPFVRGLASVKPVPGVHTLEVRGELVISKANWTAMNKVKHVGANARNVVAGVMHSKVPDPIVASKIDFVAYEILDDGTLSQSLGRQLDSLVYLGFDVVHHRVMDPPLTTDALSSFLLQRREESPYEIDGVVVAHGGNKGVQDIRGPRSVGKNPDDVFAYKTMLTHREVVVEVVDVEWNLSKDGLVKPIVHFTPVAIAGATLQKATGFNAAFIERHAIGPGSKVVVIRSGDVIPKIHRVVAPSASGKPSLPTDTAGTYEWNETRVDLRLVSKEGQREPDEVVLKRMEHLVTTLDIANVGPGVLKKLHAAGIDTLAKLVHVTSAEIERVDGFQKTSALKIAQGIKQAVEDATWLKWMVASNAFGRGFGERKLAPVLEAFPDAVVRNKRVPSPSELESVPGFGKTTARQFVDHLPRFWAFMDEIRVSVNQNPNPSTARGESEWANKTVVFTGFRNKDWEKRIEAGGGKIATAVSSKTSLVVAIDPADGASSKVARAKELGVRVIGKDAFGKIV